MYWQIDYKMRDGLMRIIPFIIPNVANNGSHLINTIISPNKKRLYYLLLEACSLAGLFVFSNVTNFQNQ